MQIYETDSLFAWERLDDSPQISTIREFFNGLRDGALLAALSDHRGRGRNDYPVRVLWYCALLQPLLRHVTMSAALDELHRNRELRELGGMQSTQEIPKEWNMSRFHDLLGTEPFVTLLHGVFDTVVSELGEAVPDLGRDVAGDATHLSARRRKQSKSSTVEGAIAQPDGGRKEYTDGEGNVVRTIEWFGYKLHLLCDTRHEVTLAYHVTPAPTADNTQIGQLVVQAAGNLPQERIRTLSYDKAADDSKVHRLLEQNGIKPVIQIREQWKEDPERILDTASGNVVHDEAGTIYCYDTTSETPVRRRMAYIGHEKSRGTLKYRCPARHAGLECPHDHHCNAGKKYGMTVRVKQEIDLRRFPPIPRATKKFERLYRRRPSVERVNSRLKVFWGADDANVAGGSPFHARIGLVMVVHAGLARVLASAKRRPAAMKGLGTTRLSPIAQALRDDSR